MLKYCYIPARAALERLGTDEHGLTAAEAAARLAKNGANAIEKTKRANAFTLFLSQFGDVMTLLLVAAAAVSGAIAFISRDFSDLTDTLIIIAIIALNAAVGTVQQYRADRAIENLKKLSAPSAVVLRDGKRIKLPAAELTVGDVIELDEGDLVPADCRIIEARSLKADESSLTGESLPVDKRDGVVGEGQTALGSVFNMLFASTFVVRGRARAVVTGTGRHTQIGVIADMLEGEGKGKTPLERSLDKLGKVLSAFVVAVAAVIFAFSAFARGEVLRSFMTSVAIAVAAIPEGLPAVVTIIMALGVQRMSRKNVVIRKLRAVETLGCCTCICTDKTGTLTRNKMEVRSVYPQANKEILTCMATCNNAMAGGGDPTEAALRNYVKELGFSCTLGRIAEEPFTSERRMMSVFCSDGCTYVKGAPDVLIKLCTHISQGGVVRAMTEGDVGVIEGRNAALSDAAMRVLAFAYRRGKGESGLTFLGLAGLADGLKPGVKQAVEECRRAGITTVMITGDHARTALAVAKQAGICYDASLVYSGEQLDAMSARDRAAAIRRGRVFARVTPAHKNAIVKVKRRAGEVVAMTGDGVNDAPSIKSADIGVAMGVSGTDVTKSVADMVIADDSFTTIVAAVREGRRISSNISKTVNFYLSTNLAEVLAILIATFAFAGCDFLLSTQLLWINLITDSFPVLALGVERDDADSMLRPPVRPQKAMLGRSSLAFSACAGAYICAATLGVYAFALYSWSNAIATTMAFMTISFSELFHAFNVRSGRSALGRGALSNRVLVATVALGVAANVALSITPLASAFGIAALSGLQWLVVFGLSLSVVLFGELYKLAVRLLRRPSKRRAGVRVSK